jgi:hypothetical protein
LYQAQAAFAKDNKKIGLAQRLAAARKTAFGVLLRCSRSPPIYACLHERVVPSDGTGGGEDVNRAPKLSVPENTGHW